MSPDTNKAMARASLTPVIGEGKLDRLDDSVAYEPGTQCGIKMISWLREVFPDLRLTIADQIAAGDKVVTRMTFHGTHQGACFGIAPTGRHVTWQGIAIDQIVDSTVVDMWHEVDRLGMREQRGAA